MRVLTLNIWNYEPMWETRRAAIVHIIETADADVVALQETRHDFRYERGAGQGAQIAHLTGYSPTEATAQVYLPFPRIDEGLTILTREQPLRTSVRPFTLFPHLRADENHRVCLSVAIDRGGRVVHVFDTHFSLDPTARLGNARELAETVDREAGAEPAVVMGDLNAEPLSPEIAYLTEEVGFRDVWREARGDDRGYTYASFNPVRRIDYILVKNMPVGPLSARLVGKPTPDGIYASDHLGVLADLPLP